MAVPLGLSLLGAMLVLLIFLFPFQLNIPKEFWNIIQSKIKKLGPLQSPQKITLAVFALASFLWIFKAVIHSLCEFEFLNDTFRSDKIITSILIVFEFSWNFPERSFILC